MTVYTQNQVVQKEVPLNPLHKGVVITEIFDVEISDSVRAGDIVEIGTLPANSYLMDGIICFDNFEYFYSNIGMLTGEPGDVSETRELEVEFSQSIYIGSGVASFVSSNINAARTSTDDAAKSIGLLVTENNEPKNSKITFKLSYIKTK